MKYVQKCPKNCTMNEGKFSNYRKKMGKFPTKALKNPKVYFI